MCPPSGRPHGIRANKTVRLAARDPLMKGNLSRGRLILLPQCRGVPRLTSLVSMPIWPKNFYTFGVNLQSAATEWKLRKKRSGPAAQDRALAALTPRLAATAFWREAGVEAGMPYARFQTKVPLQTHEQLSPAIERMRRGESDVLWPGRCALFAQSSGTTTGLPKSLPVTEEMLRHFRRASLDALLYYTVRVKNAGAFRGRHLILGGSTALTPIAEAAPHEAYAGELSGIVAVNLPDWADKHLYEPGAAAAKLTDWEEKLDAIVARTCLCDISLMAGIPPWIIQLADELHERCANGGNHLKTLQTLWPNLECLVHTGVPIAPFAAELRNALGPTVNFHEVYAASEGFIATQDTEVRAAGLRLMADLGVFFEFLPMSDFDSGRLSQLGAKAVPLAGVKTGIDYALVLTTPAGLARVVIGDVVRFVSKEPARLFHVGDTHAASELVRRTSDGKGSDRRPRGGLLAPQLDHRELSRRAALCPGQPHRPEPRPSRVVDRTATRDRRHSDRPANRGGARGGVAAQQPRLCGETKSRRDRIADRATGDARRIQTLVALQGPVGRPAQIPPLPGRPGDRR
ncbi:MAG: hypothetical protein EXS37_21350 [Opitutus sp.]|nr:hypothetical protein [Opitutus sp.]